MTVKDPYAAKKVLEAWALLEKSTRELIEHYRKDRDDALERLGEMVIEAEGYKEKIRKLEKHLQGTVEV